MLHYDGELDPARAREVERLLASDPKARRLLADLERMGSLLREAEAAEPKRADLTSAILDRVFAPSAPDAEPKLTEHAALVPKTPRRALAWAFGSVALAAALALVLSREPAPLERAKAPAPARAAEPSVSGNKAPNLESETSEESVAVETVDFGSSQGAIFLVPSATSPMLVVWTLDDEADKGRGVDL